MICIGYLAYPILEVEVLLKIIQTQSPSLTLEKPEESEVF